MPFTRIVENWIKPEEKMYTRTIDGLLVPVIKPISQLSLDVYIKKVIYQMEAARQEFCNCYLGFSLIRRLHTKLARATDDPAIYEIEGRLFHIDNTHRPSIIHDKHPDELNKYVEVFTELAKNSGKIVVGKDISEGLLRSRFHKILSENRYVGVRGGTTAISRENIIDICIYLGWNSDDADYLLLRMDDSCLSANSASDLISRFVLDVPEATMEDGKKLRGKYRRALRVTRPLHMEDKTPGGTQERAAVFGGILENKDQLSRKQLCEQYAEALVFFAPILELPSLTARDYLERILRVAYVRMGNKDEAIPDVPNNVKLVIFDDDIKSLDPHERGRLVEALLSETAEADGNVLHGTDTISYSIAYDAMAYPVINEEGGFAQQLMGARFIRLLDGEEHVTKRDMLYAIYLMESIKWRNEKATTAKTLSNRYTAFKVLADDILMESFLPPFYPVQTLEFVIGKAIMSNLRAEDVFTEITGRFNSLKDPEIDLISRMPAEGKDIKPNEDFAYKQTLDNLNDYLYLRTSKMTVMPLVNLDNADEDSRKDSTNTDTEVSDNDLMQELSDLARKLYDIWKSVQFDSLNVNFEKSGQIGVKAVGLSENAKYIIIWRMSEKLKRLLHAVEIYDPKKKTASTILEEFCIPDLDGTKRSLAQYAQQYRVIDDEPKEEKNTLLDEPEEEKNTLLYVLKNDPDWNRRLRRKAIISVIVGMILNLYGKKELSDQYRLSKVKKAVDPADPEKAILQAVSIDEDEEDEQDVFRFFAIYPKDKALLKLYPASKDDYENHLENRLIKN